jgi:hypothetical protein
MSTLSPDTHPEAERVHMALLRGATPAAHFRLVRSLSATAIRLARRAAARRAASLPGTPSGGTMEADLLDALTPVADALERLGAPCRIGGSVASSIHGVPRRTSCSTSSRGSAWAARAARFPSASGATRSA